MYSRSRAASCSATRGVVARRSCDLLDLGRHPLDVVLGGARAELRSLRLGPRVHLREVLLLLPTGLDRGLLLGLALQLVHLLERRDHVGVLVREATRAQVGQVELHQVELSLGTELLLDAGDRVHGHDRLLLVEGPVALGERHGLPRLAEAVEHALELPLVRGQVFGKAAGVLVLDLGDPRLDLAKLARQPLQLGGDELGGVARDLDPLLDVLVDEVVGEAVRHVGGDLGPVAAVVEPEGVDLDVLALAPRVGLELGKHGLDTDVGPHQRDDFLPGHPLGLLGVEPEVVDHLGEPPAAQDLHGHQVQAVVEVARGDAGLDQLARDRLRLDQERHPCLVSIGEDASHYDGREEHTSRDRTGDPCTAAHDARQIPEL